MPGKLIILWTFLIIFTLILPLTGQNAVIVEEKQNFKTYPFSDPDPVARMGRIYPYFRFDGYSREGKKHQWDVVRMENPYIKVLITPQIGGKIWGAIEKSTGLPFIYTNKVVKFRDIGMRGPWTSGGIEFNFGAIGHAPTTSTPVDYILKGNKDGSVSCIVGAMDLPSRTQWRVHIKLPRDKAFFETTCTWYNPSPLNHSYYHWMNAAADIGEDLKFYYPGSYYIGHDGKKSRWSMDKNKRDLSYYTNNRFGAHKSYHVLGAYSEYFGGYWHDKDFGFGNWSLYDDKPGKKLWLWALSRQGGIWQHLLTDPGNQQYIEYQSGRLLNQAANTSSKSPFKHAYFPPYTFDRWSELWFPFKQTGGIKDASPYGVLYVEKQDNGKQLSVAICALQNIKRQLTVSVRGKIVFGKTIDLKPMEVFTQKVDVQLNPYRDLYTVRVGEMLSYSSRGSENNRLNRWYLMKEVKDIDWTTAEGFFIAGEEASKQRNYNEALTAYKKCLQLEPAHLRAMVRLAHLSYGRGSYSTAFLHAQQALSIDAYDAGANFVLALVRRKMGRLLDAKEALTWAARSMTYRSAAYVELAAIWLMEGNLERTTLYARRSLDFNRFNLAAYRLLAIAARKQQQQHKAQKVLDKILDIDPLNHFARFEHYLWQPLSDNRQNFTSMVRSELPHETYLELAISYANLGLDNEAVQVLELSPHYPMVNYWLAYLHRQSNRQKSKAFLKKSVDASARLVFPFRNETMEVLEWALKQTDDWKTRYYLGLICWHNGWLKKALTYFDQCGEQTGFAPLYLARGNLRRAVAKKKLEGNAVEASGNHLRVLTDYNRAKAANPDQWRAWHTLTRYYQEIERHDLALDTASKIYKKIPHNYIIALDYANALLLNQKFKKSLDVLERTIVLPFEGASEGRDIYRNANLGEARRLIANKKYKAALHYIEAARLWPEHLGVGKPYNPDETEENRLGAIVRNAMEK